MVTRLKKYKYSTGLKFTAFITAVLLFTCSIVSFIYIINFSNAENFELFDSISAYDYTDTSEFQSDKFHLLDVTFEISKYKDANSIINGDSITEERIQQEKERIFNRKREVIADSFIRKYDYYPDERVIWDIFNNDYATEVARIKEQLISEDLKHYNRLMDELNGRDEVLYFIKTDDSFISNMRKITESSFKTQSHVYEGYDRRTYIAYSPYYMDMKNNAFMKFANKARETLRNIALLLISTIFCFMYLIFATGKRTYDNKIHHSIIDKPYNEFTLGLVILTCMGVIGLLASLSYTSYYKGTDNVLVFGLFMLLNSIGLSFFLALIRHIKTRTLLRHTLIYTIFIKIITFLCKIFRNGSLMRKTIGAILVLGILTMIPFLGIITIPFIIWIAFNKVTMFNKIQTAVSEVKDGCYTEPIKTKSKGEFKKLSEYINQITEGLNEEVERRLKAERMKTELISNVSHDIRTPLTSIITYIDLLKAEETKNDNIKKYIGIIDQKSDRLKRLIDDLFEASKAASGNIPVEPEKIDVVALITQGLGELNDKIKASNLNFKVSRSGEKLYVLADGRLLWRIIENLLSNVFKYSLKNSRVYIDFIEDYNYIGIEIKNISAYELNIKEHELMERFKRGDESRSTPGSGLGLAIAESLALTQNGKLKIKIDGDLFKATVLIPKYEESYDKIHHN